MNTTKTEAKHTPGPWECHKFKRHIESEKGYSPFEILQPLINKTGEYAGKLGGYNTVLGKRNCNQGYVLTEADARLMATAPELLEALKYLVQEVKLNKLNIRKDFSLINAHAVASKAIYKAGGNQ